MHLGLIIGEERLENERGMLDRLVAGLLEAGDEVTRFLPDSDESHGADAAEDDSLVTIAVPMSVPPWLARSRARQMANTVEKALPDVIYAIGEDAWPIGLQFAAELERPVAIDLWCDAQTKSAPRSRGANQVAAYIAATGPLGRAVSPRVGPDLVSVVPMGVPVPDDPPPILQDADESISMAIMGAGHDTHAHAAMLAALQRVVRELPQIQAVIELREPHAHAVWREANRLDLLGHLSAITNASHWVSRLRTCDVLLVPEAAGQMRTLLLEAMAAGMAIIAAEDPALDVLEDGDSAVVVGGRPHPEHWGSAIRKVLMSRGTAATLGESAHRRVAERHRVAHQVDALRATFARILSGGAYSFKEARGST